jgi:hypothetical protein
MFTRISRLLFCVVVMASLAGCGGGSGSGPSGGCTTNCGGGGGNPTTVTYAFSGAMPTAVATRIGTGAFSQATLESGKLSISVPGGTTNYSVAWVCPADARYTPPATDEYVYQANTQDGTSFTWYCDDDGATVTSGAATVQVDASAISGGAWVYAGGGIGDNQAGLSQPWSSGTLNLSGQMLVGTYDVFVYVEDLNFNMLAVKILRNQTLPGTLNSGNAVVFAISDEVTSQSLAMNNVPSGFTVSQTLVDYLTPTFGDALPLDFGFGALTQYTALPSGAMQSGDYYWFDAGASGSTNPNVSEYVGVEVDSSSGGAQTISLPTPWSYAGPTAAALPTFSFDYTGFSGMTNVVQHVGLNWDQGNVSNTTQVWATANYQDGATSIAVPNLSGLTGFLAPAPSGTNIFWYAGAEQGFPLLSSPTNGTLSIVQDSGTYTEP